MSNETKPLLSDERIAEVMGKEFIEGFNDYKVACGSARAVRDLYESERTKLIAVLQVCADALADPHKMSLGADALSQLKAIGVEPNK